MKSYKSFKILDTSGHKVFIFLQSQNHIMYKHIPKTALYSLFLLFMVNSCSDDSGMNCFTPPTPIVFQFEDQLGNNLIENGSLNTSQIKVREHEADGSVRVIQFNVIENRIVLQEVGFYAGTDNYTLTSPVIDFGFSVTSSEITGNCAGYKIDEVVFDGVTPEITDYYVYVIKVEAP